MTLEEREVAHYTHQIQISDPDYAALSKEEILSLIESGEIYLYHNRDKTKGVSGRIMLKDGGFFLNTSVVTPRVIGTFTTNHPDVETAWSIS